MNQRSYSSPRRRPQKKGISGLTIFLIIAGVIGFFVVAAIGGLIFFISQARGDSDEMKTVVANDRTSQLEIPSNWQKITGADSNLEASIQYGNLFGEKYAMVLTERKSDLYQMFGNDFSIDDFAELVTEGTGELEFKAGPSKKLTVNGLPSRRFRMTTKLEGLSIVYLVTLVEGDSNFHQVHTWTLASHEKKNMPILTQVSDSFKEK